MSRNAEGEFELILGNKQLLSLFFLVVVLFAVFFSLGYMVGKTVAPAPLASAPGGSASGLLAASTGGLEPPPSPGRAAEAPLERAAPVVETQPARSDPTPADEPHAADPRPGSSPAVVARELHLQVAAVRVKDDAEALVASLKKRGHQALIYAHARDGWYRVILGPYGTERLALEAKTQLEKDGFKSIVKRP